MAAGRDQRELQYLQSATEPAVIELISRVARHGRDAAKEVSVCGDAAFGPDLAALLRTGISTVSVPAQRGAEVKSLIRMAGVSSS
jgi:phosphoenolpyruvate-protein kinase (PTS system EI component)